MHYVKEINARRSTRIPWRSLRTLTDPQKTLEEIMRRHRLAETDEQKIYDKCDQLYPKLRNGRCCAVCLSMWRMTPADHIHHIIPRANPITRFYLPNLIPLCCKHHQMIHEGKLTEPISEQHRDHLIQMANKSFKGLCIAKGITKAEYFQDQYEKMKEQLL